MSTCSFFEDSASVRVSNQLMDPLNREINFRKEVLTSSCGLTDEVRSLLWELLASGKCTTLLCRSGAVTSQRFFLFPICFSLAGSFFSFSGTSRFSCITLALVFSHSFIRLLRSLSFGTRWFFCPHAVLCFLRDSFFVGQGWDVTSVNGNSTTHHGRDAQFKGAVSSHVHRPMPRTLSLMLKRRLIDLRLHCYLALPHHGVALCLLPIAF